MNILSWTPVQNFNRVTQYGLQCVYHQLHSEMTQLHSQILNKNNNNNNNQNAKPRVASCTSPIFDNKLEKEIYQTIQKYANSNGITKINIEMMHCDHPIYTISQTINTLADKGYIHNNNVEGNPVNAIWKCSILDN